MEVSVCFGTNNQGTVCVTGKRWWGFCDAEVPMLTLNQELTPRIKQKPLKLLHQVSTLLCSWLQSKSLPL